MQALEKLTRDYSKEPVPDDQTVGALRIALVIVAVGITLPVLLAGSEIGLALGLARATKSFAIGGVVLAFIGCLTAYIGAKSRLSTYMITQFSFGTGGARAVNLLIAVTLFGWYGVTASMFGKATQSAVLDICGVDLGQTAFVALGSLLMIVTTVWGFKALDKLSLFAVPLKVALLTGAVWFALQRSSWDVIARTTGGGLREGVATSLVIGSYVVGSILLPDLTRYSRQPRDGIVAAVLALGVAFPCIFLAGAIPSLAIGNKDLVVIMMGLGMGAPSLAMIVFATWTANASNLYSTSLTLATVFTSHQKWKITVVAGLLGTLVAVFGIIDYFTNFLLFLGICIPPIAGIYIADFFFVRRGNYSVEMLRQQSSVSNKAFVAWLLSSLVGYASAHDMIVGSSVPACDAMAAAFLIYLSLKRLPLRSWLRGGNNRTELE